MKLSARVKQQDVSDTDAKTIGEISGVAGDSEGTISSVKRNAGDQARVMFDNLEGKGDGKGIKAQRKLYNGAPGEQVVGTYSKLKALQANASLFGGVITGDQIKKGMESKINQLGVANVTRHASSDPNLNVVDVAPSSVSNQNAFRRAASSHPNVQKFIPYPKDPGHHLEIKN